MNEIPGQNFSEIAVKPKHMKLRFLAPVSRVVASVGLLLSTQINLPRPVEGQSQSDNYSYVDDGSYPQCLDIQYLPKSDLDRDPMTFMYPRHPEIEHAIDTVYRNGIYNLIDVQLLPVDTQINFISAPMYQWCLPDPLLGHSRDVIQTSEGSGLNMPTGWTADGQKPVSITIPDGLHPIYVERTGQKYPGGETRIQRWIFYNLQPEESFIVSNASGSFRETGYGPMAIELSEEGYHGVNHVDYATIVLPNGEHY